MNTSRTTSANEGGSAGYKFAVLTDDDVEQLIVQDVAIAVARRALVAASTGELTGQPRLSAQAGTAQLVFTVGGLAGQESGFRVYGEWDDRKDDLVAVWSASGELAGLVVGRKLGDYRTGSLGGVAVDMLANANCGRLGVLGSGRMAWTQVWATCHVRTFESIRVFSPTRSHAEAFALRIEHTLGIEARAAPSARTAVVDADVVIVSTRSRAPAVSADWLKPGCHVNSTGPKWGGSSELDPRIAERASVIVSDSPAQAIALPAPWFTDRRMEHLGGVVRGEIPGRRKENDLTLYCSMGLAGSEPLLATELIRRKRLCQKR